MIIVSALELKGILTERVVMSNHGKIMNKIWFVSWFLARLLVDVLHLVVCSIFPSEEWKCKISFIHYYLDRAPRNVNQTKEKLMLDLKQMQKML